MSGEICLISVRITVTQKNNNPYVTRILVLIQFQIGNNGNFVERTK